MEETILIYLPTFIFFVGHPVYTESYSGLAMGAQPPSPWKSGGFDFQGGSSPQRWLSPRSPSETGTSHHVS